MKKYLIVSLLFMGAALICYSCNPSEKTVSIPNPVNAGSLKFSVTQNSSKDNIVYLKNLTASVIPYWDFGSGTSTLDQDTVIFPFSGDYLIKYNAVSSGGYVPGDSITVHVSNTDLSYLQDPSWSYITGGQQGKTWVLDMTQPIGWYGLNYPKHDGSDDWSWHPDYASNSWVMPNRDYGQMSFNLDNGKNYSVTQISSTGIATTTHGKFDLNLASRTMKLIGAELLYGGDYHSQATNWSNVTLLDLSANSITLGVLRDHPNPGDGVCYIGYTFKLKP